MNITEIILAYSAGTKTLEETNEALTAAGSNVKINPGQNELTAEDIASTKVGETAAETTGFGLLSTGTGSYDKVQVVAGKLTGGAINEVAADGSVNMKADVIIGGKLFAVKGDELA